MFNTCLFKQGRNLCNTSVKNSFENISKNRFNVLNDDKILAEVLEKFPCLPACMTKAYWVFSRAVVRNAWVEVAKKIGAFGRW